MITLAQDESAPMDEAAKKIELDQLPLFSPLQSIAEKKERKEGESGRGKVPLLSPLDLLPSFLFLLRTVGKRMTVLL